MQLLVGVVDDELLEPVALRYLEAVEVEDADHVVFPRSLHLVEIKWRSRVSPRFSRSSTVILDFL